MRNYVRLRMVSGDGMFYGGMRKFGWIWLIGSVHFPGSSWHVIPVVFVTYGEEIEKTLSIVRKMAEVAIVFVV